MDTIEQAKEKLEGVRALIIEQDGEAVYDCNYQDLDEALALLESAKAEQPPAGEFTKKARETLSYFQHDVNTPLPRLWCLDACDRLDAQQQEIERLKEENADLKRPLEVNGFKAEGMMAVGKELTRLTAENEKEKECSNFMGRLLEALIGEGWNKLTIYEAKKRQAENKAQADLHREEIFRLNDKCVAMRRELEAEILALRRELLERGGHSRSCHNQLLHGAAIECTCGWDARRDQLEADAQIRHDMKYFPEDLRIQEKP